MGFDSKYGFTPLGLSQDFSEKVGSKSQYGVRVGGFPGGSLFMGFSRQEYQSGLPHPPSGDLPSPGIKPQSLISPH